jgi:hypothetical protein
MAELALKTYGQMGLVTVRQRLRWGRMVPKIRRDNLFCGSPWRGLLSRNFGGNQKQRHNCAYREREHHHVPADSLHKNTSDRPNRPTDDKKRAAIMLS